MIISDQEEPPDDENGKAEDSVVMKVEACTVADQEKRVLPKLNARQITRMTLACERKVK